MAKSIFVSDETHRNLMLAKMEMGFRSLDDMLEELVVEVRKARFLEASEAFRAGMKRKGLSLRSVERKGEAIRIELFKKWLRESRRHS